MATQKLRTITYPWAIDQPHWETEHFHAWLAKQPPARWITVVRRGRTEGFLDREAHGTLQLLRGLPSNVCPPGSVAEEPTGDPVLRWPWSRAFAKQWLERLPHAPSEMTDVLAWVADVAAPAAATRPRAAHGVWWVLLAVAMAPVLHTEGVDASALRARVLAWSARLVDECAPGAEQLIAPSVRRWDRRVHADSVAVVVTPATGYFPLDPPRHGHAWAAAPWESVTAAFAACPHRRVLAHGEVWLPLRVLLYERLVQTAAVVVDKVLTRSWAWFHTDAGRNWQRHPRVQAFLLDVYASLRRLLQPSPPAAVVVGHAALQRDRLPPCLARVLRRPSHLKHEARVRVWSSLMACGATQGELEAHTRRHIAVMYPGATTEAARQKQATSLVREIEQLYRTRLARRVTYENSCVRWRLTDMATVRDCMQCDAACAYDVEDVATLRTPSSRYAVLRV